MWGPVEEATQALPLAYTKYCALTPAHTVHVNRYIQIQNQILALIGRKSFVPVCSWLPCSVNSSGPLGFMFT